MTRDRTNLRSTKTVLQSKDSSQGTPRHASEITEDETTMKQKNQKRDDIMDDNRLNEDEESAAQFHDCLNLTCS